MSNKTKLSTRTTKFNGLANLAAHFVFLQVLYAFPSPSNVWQIKPRNLNPVASAGKVLMTSNSNISILSGY